MRLPQMQYAGDRRKQQALQFGGLQYGRNSGEGEFAETRNLSSRQFPTLSQRGARKKTAGYEAATALFAKNKLVVVDGTSLLYDGAAVGTVTEGEKQIVSVNSKILVFPDKVYYDTNSETFGAMEASVSAEAEKVTWTEETLKLETEQDLTKLFSVGQAVKLSGSSNEKNNQTLVLRGVSKDTLTFSTDSFAGSTDTEKNTVTVAREVPDFACVCESANRLWGAEGNTIWASALGDPLTFYNYEGLSTDAYAVAVGTDGAFTGCTAYSSNVLFFKEHVLHKVLGSMPSEYRVYDYTVPGVQAGSHKSMVVVNEILYYKGVDGVYAYNGSTPSLISANFGLKRFQKAAAGTDGGHYYISMEDAESGAWGLFVYDTAAGIWLREDETHAVDFARQDTVLHFLNAGDGGVYAMDQSDEWEGRFPWMAEFTPMDDTIYGKRGYSKLWLKCELAPGAWLKAEISEDGAPWHDAGIWSDSTRGTVIAPIFPTRCDTFRLRLSGMGRCVVKNMVREFDVGSEW